MRQRFKKAVLMSLVFCLFPGLMLNSFAFSDMSGHWAEDVVSKWAGKEVVKGLPDDTFRPDANITRAEFVTIVGNVMKYVNKSSEEFVDVPETEWYAEHVAKAVAAGVTTGVGNGKFAPKNSITRQEAAVMIYRAFRLQVKNKNAADKFSDAGLIATWAKDAVSALTEKGYVTGRPGNRFAPLDYITRAEALKIIDNILDDIVNNSGEYSGDISENLLVNTGDVTLKGMTVKGTLYLAEGIGDGNVTLDNVTVHGDILVYGGGENSIKLKDTVVDGNLYVLKYDGKVRIVAAGNTVVNNTQVLSGVNLEEKDLTSEGFGKVEVISADPGEEVVFDGDFDEVSVTASGSKLKLKNGTIGTLNMENDATGSVIELDEGTVVNTVLFDTAAGISGNGTVKNAVVKADHVILDIVPENFTVYKGFTARVGGNEVVGDYVPESEPAPAPVAIVPKSVSVTIKTGEGFKTLTAENITKKNGLYVAEFSLKSYDDNTQLFSAKIEAEPQDVVLTLTAVNGISLSTNGTGVNAEIIENVSDITVKSLIGAESVSLGTIRSLVGGGVVYIDGYLKKDGYTDVPVRLILAV